MAATTGANIISHRQKKENASWTLKTHVLESSRFLSN